MPGNPLLDAVAPRHQRGLAGPEYPTGSIQKSLANVFPRSNGKARCQALAVGSSVQEELRERENSIFTARVQCCVHATTLLLDLGKCMYIHA